MKVPDFVRVDAMPGRASAFRQQVIDRCTGTAYMPARGDIGGRTEYLPVIAAFRVRLQRQCSNQVAPDWLPGGVQTHTSTAIVAIHLHSPQAGPWICPSRIRQYREERRPSVR